MEINIPKINTYKVQNNKKKEKRPNTGTLNALLIYSAFSAAKTLSIGLIRRDFEKTNTLSSGQSKIFVDGAIKAFNYTKLANKGVEFVLFSKEPIKANTANIKNININGKEVLEITKKAFSKRPIFKKLPQKIQNQAINYIASAAATGKNAFFLTFSNQIMCGDKLSSAAFHEIGHALNKNSSRIGNLLQKLRCGSKLLTLPILILGILGKNQKPQENKELSFINKTTNFVRNNAGKLTFLAALPIVLEESLATIKGNKLAKKFLSVENAKTVTKSNKLGGATYLIAALFSSLGTYFAVKIKDQYQVIADTKYPPK